MTSTEIYRNVSPRRNCSRRVVSRSVEARLVYWHLQAGEVATNLPGLTRVGVLGLAEEMALSPEVVTAALDELVLHKLAEVDEVERLIRLPGVATDQSRAADNPKTLAGWINTLARLPHSPLVLAHAREIHAFCDPRHAELWRRLGDRFRFERQSIADRTKDQDQEQDQKQLNPPNPPDGGDLPEPDELDQVLTDVLDCLAVERSRLTGVEGRAAPPSARERTAWSRFWSPRPAPPADVLRVVRRAAEALRRRGKLHGLTLAHVLRNWERLRDAHELDVPASARAPPTSGPRALPPPVNVDPFETA